MKRLSPDDRTRRTAGWTLLELIVTISLLTMALLLSGPLLHESLRHVVLEEQRALETQATLALRQLRADVTAARGVSEVPEEKLILSLPGQRQITYRLQGDELRRRLDNDQASGSGERTVLSDVSTFRWTLLGFGKSSVHVQLAGDRIRRGGPVVADGERVVRPTEPYRPSLVLTLRGGGGVGW